MIRNNFYSPARAAGYVAVLAAALLAAGGAAHAQLMLGDEVASLTVEGYLNSSAAGSNRGLETPTVFDGALRLLGLTKLGERGSIGARVVFEGRAGDDGDIDTGERSVMLLQRWGRLEYGRRQGLPDILTGYGPNNFTFTTAEFGPASGLSLDPAGGLPSAFLRADEAMRLGELATLGFATSMFDDRSRKVIYVSPKWHGFLGGASFSSDAGRDGDALGELLQLGLTHERYVGRHVFRYGGSYNRLQVLGARDQESANAGISATLNDTWLVGISAGYDTGGLRFNDARGVVTSVNYNYGRWTVGGFLQWARADRTNLSSDRLRAGEFGLSYRTSRQLRWFAGYNRSLLDPADPQAAPLAVGVVVAGVRIAL